MADVRIVKLGPTDISLQTASFDEAMGEYSELRGKGRARRKKRKLERIANRREVQAARREARKERKVGRQEVRSAAKQARIAKRRAAQQARLEKRGAAMEARAARRGKRRQLREDRRAIGAEQEDLMDEQTMIENGEMGGAEQAGYQEPVAEETEAPAAEQGGAAEDEWGGTGSVYENDNEDLGDAAEGTSEDEESVGDETEGEDAEGFDGVMGAEDRFFEFSDADGIKVTPAVADAAKKIEWNKEFLSRLNVKKAKIQGQNGDASEVSKQIELRKRRIADLEDQLTKFANCMGSYSSADGEEFSFVNGEAKNATPAQKRGRARQVLKAKGMAIRERRRLHRGDVTPVAKGLSPEFSPNRIVVPAAEALNYTGLNGLDLMDDYDAPATRIVELQSNADGTGAKKINWTGIVIGGAVAVAAIWAIRKYKLLGK